MTRVPGDWKETDLAWNGFADQGLLAIVAGWTFWEHPTKGDEGHVLAISLDRIGPNGSVVYDTGEYEVPDFM